MKLIGLGANLPSPHGQPKETLEEALLLLPEAGIAVVQKSRWYETEPLLPEGGMPQPPYINAVAQVDTRLSAKECLSALQDIEKQLGRKRGERWQARVCDLDLLAYDDMIVGWEETPEGPVPNKEGLVIPHPGLHERAFVLLPLQDIAPDWVHPVLKRRLPDMISDLGNIKWIHLLGEESPRRARA